MERSRGRVWPRNLVRATALFFLALMAATRLQAYSVLTHEEIVDLLWTPEIRDLLLHRFPGLTPDQLREAHAYAYGGSVIQDLGYYPFGSTEFSDLVHYVRSGDFVRELVLESQDADEYAFALGALAHYVSDIDGHPAVNQAVAIEYPKLRAKYGRFVLYADDKAAHLKTEFGFDTLQIAKNRYAPEQYHDFIGFQVSEPLLERVFPVIYGLDLKDVLKHEDLAVGSYRWAISRLIPEMTQVALAAAKKDKVNEKRDRAKEKFLYHLSRSDYEREWGKTYNRPGLGARILAVFVRILPKIGPFKGLGFKNPTPQTEDLYIKSIDKTVDHYRALLAEARANKLDLPNFDLDSGNPTRGAEYSLADESYTSLLDKLADGKFEQTTPQLRKNILSFYSDSSAPIETKKDQARWQQVLANLDRLKATAPVPEAATSPAR
jgi:hypothetical protein